MDMKKKYQELYQESEDILLKELGLYNLKIGYNLTFLAQKQEIDQSERIDADYFQPKYKRIVKKIKEYPLLPVSL